MEQLRDEMLSYCQERLWPDPSEAEDFVQRSFERLCRRGEIVNPRALLYEITKGLLKNEYRDRETRPALESFERVAWTGETWEGLDHLPQFQTHDFEDSEFTEAHEAAVRGLNDGPQLAYILGELRGLPSREAGALLGISHTTAATHREAATAAVREEITQ